MITQKEDYYAEYSIWSVAEYKRQRYVDCIVYLCVSFSVFL